MAVEVRNPTWFCAAVMPDPENPFRVIAFEYCYDNDRNPDRIQIKLPGGTRKKNGDRNDTTPEETLVREVAEEVIKDRQGESGEGEPLLGFDLPLREGRPGHTKYFFIVRSFTGKLRKEQLFEESQGKAEEDGVQESRTERMGPPDYINLEKLVRVIFYSHLPALRAYVEQLAVNLEYLDRALDILSILARREQE